MGGVTVFLGPTLPLERARRLLPAATFEPPARMGSVYRAVRGGARTVGLVDGYYERVPAVWHKEILWALAAGARVFGASSMGALRATELDAFGMVGIGEIYRWYRDGEIEDDDEVALFHGPAASGYAASSEPLVNMRATLRAAEHAGALAAPVAAGLLAEAKSMHYSERTYESVLDAGREAGLPRPVLAAFEAWLPAGRVDQKGRDAEELLRAMAAPHAAHRPVAAVPEFEPTWIWQELVDGQAQR